jgi:hypothetical protein
MRVTVAVSGSLERLSQQVHRTASVARAGKVVKGEQWAHLSSGTDGHAWNVEIVDYH